MSETLNSSPAHGVTSQRCFNHDQREAAAVCLECSRTFCRECVTEHDDRVICASCLPTIASRDAGRSTSLRPLLLALQGLLGFALLWLSFFTLGQILLQMPAEFHDGADPAESALP
ncbi:MAG: rhomboid family protein [Verrucomicrobia bacterium]|nr:rhomboid family protein [Verrucomicrobiota bacterium]MDA1087354.1 rhomboid family protein [Verrucomicrobiota bacterium]